MFLSRLGTTLFLLTFMGISIYFSQTFFGAIIPLSASLLSIIGIIEFFKMCGITKDKKIFIIYSSAFAFCYVWLLYLFLKNQWNSVYFETSGIFIFVFFLFLLMMFQNNDFSKKHVFFPVFGASVGSFLYIPWSLGFALKVLYGTTFDGRIFFLYLILVSKSADIFAYITGKLLGRKKLSPRISPGKTIEGAFGGILGSLTVSFLLFAFFRETRPFFTFHQTLFLGVSLPVISMLGDLAESLLKRDAGCKDSGHYIPGLGGSLDLLDSLLFCSPFMFLMMRLFI